MLCRRLPLFDIMIYTVTILGVGAGASVQRVLGARRYILIVALVWGHPKNGRGMQSSKMKWLYSETAMDSSPSCQMYHTQVC